MPGPQFPLFQVSDDPWCNVVKGPDELAKWTMLGIIRFRPDSSVFYDSNQTKWMIQDLSAHREITWLDRLLASTVYNPLTQVHIIWASKGTYELEELTKEGVKCVEADGDVLTQFVEGEFLIRKINACTSLVDLFDVFEKYVIHAEGT